MNASTKIEFNPLSGLSGKAQKIQSWMDRQQDGFKNPFLVPQYGGLKTMAKYNAQGSVTMLLFCLFRGDQPVYSWDIADPKETQHIRNFENRKWSKIPLYYSQDLKCILRRCRIGHENTVFENPCFAKQSNTCGSRKMFPMKRKYNDNWYYHMKFPLR